MNPFDSTHRLSNDLLEKRDEKAHAFSPRDARWTLAWIWIAGGDNWNLARGSRFDFRQRARTLRRNRATFSSLISARTPFQLISFLFWQFFLQPTNLSRLSFTLAPTSSFFFFFFGHTIFANGVLDYTSDNEVVRGEGGRKMKLAVLVTLRLSASPLFILVCLFFFLIFQCEIRDLSPSWRMTNQSGYGERARCDGILFSRAFSSPFACPPSGPFIHQL